MLYANIFDGPIYFLENSAHDLVADEAFQEILRMRRIELMKFPLSVGVTQAKVFKSLRCWIRRLESWRGAD